MLFEEFFKKKKISLDALQQGDPGLFSEFKLHYEQMGEKSFDHTKKFWFNKLRHQYPLPPEIKAEKLRSENQIAEQTVADTLTEPSPQTQAPKLGFTPKFKTQAAPPMPPVTETPKAEPAAADKPPKEGVDKPAAYKPRFQAKNIPAKPADNIGNDEPDENATALPNAPVGEQPEAPAKIGFKPRFKAGVTTNKPVETKEDQPEVNKEVERYADAEQSTSADAVPPAKLGFKPRFKAGVSAVKPLDESTAPSSEKEVSENSASTIEEDVPQAPDAPKLGFKPRFKAGITAVKPAESIEQPAQPLVVQNEAPSDKQPESPAEPVPPPKPGFKPRFKAGVTTTKPAENNSEQTSAEQEAGVNKEADKGVAEMEKPEATNDAPAKPVYKPRFNPNMVKRNPTNEE
ncbi:hypothetical protein [Mucilaginibacter sp. CSA2-8R]|uniref:hypothetical protein n=1 Tax=Mucilaginibacter sp. CSA2-8R TaxID=3141542 RepID=UPI00315D1DC0